MDMLVPKAAERMTWTNDRGHGTLGWPRVASEEYSPSPPPILGDDCQVFVRRTAPKNDGLWYLSRGASPDPSASSPAAVPTRKSFLQRTLEPNPGAMVFKLMPKEIFHSLGCRKETFSTVSDPLEFEEACCDMQREGAGMQLNNSSWERRGAELKKVAGMLLGGLPRLRSRAASTEARSRHPCG